MNLNFEVHTSPQVQGIQNGLQKIETGSSQFQTAISTLQSQTAGFVASDAVLAATAASTAHVAGADRSRAIQTEKAIQIAVAEVDTANIALSNRLAAEQSRALRQEAFVLQTVIAGLASERSRAMDSEMSLTASVSAAEVLRAVAFENLLRQALATEQSRALWSEARLQGAVVTANALNASILGLQTDIAAINSDTLSAISAVSAEVSRTLSEQQSFVVAEAGQVSRAMAAEASLGLGLAAETSRALAAESLLSQAGAPQPLIAAVSGTNYEIVYLNASYAGASPINMPSATGYTVYIFRAGIGTFTPAFTSTCTYLVRHGP